MRVYVKRSPEIYGIVYMLAPKDDTVHVRQIWLPHHLQSEKEGVCHYELKFDPQDERDDVRNQWLDGLPELLINWYAKRLDGSEIQPEENVILIEHDSGWEFELLIEIVNDPMWENEYKMFDIRSKVGHGVRLRTAKE